VVGRISTWVRIQMLSKIHTTILRRRVDDSRVPSIPVRLSLVKLFLELSLFDPALLTLQGIMASDDQEVEAWYLEGRAFYLMAELAHDSPNGKLCSVFEWSRSVSDLWLTDLYGPVFYETLR